MATKSEVAAQILPSLGPGKCQEKTEHFEHKFTWVTGSPSSFKQGTKIFHHLQCQPISPYWFVRWSGPLKHFGPREGGGGVGVGVGVGLGGARACTWASPAGFYFHIPPCSLGPLGCLGVLSFPPYGQK